MNDKEFTELYNGLLKYSRNLIYSHRRKTGNDSIIIEAEDLALEAISKGCEDVESAKKMIRICYLTEMQRERASRQYLGITDGYIKKCNKCNFEKDSSEFSQREDSRTGLIYLNFICNDCNSDYRKKLYSESDIYKLKAKLRYIKWKKKHKKYEYAV